MRRPEDHLVSRVREIRMHGLNGGLTHNRPGATRSMTGKIYQCDEGVVATRDRECPAACREPNEEVTASVGLQHRGAVALRHLAHRDPRDLLERLRVDHERLVVARRGDVHATPVRRERDPFRVLADVDARDLFSGPAVRARRRSPRPCRPSRNTSRRTSTPSIKAAGEVRLRRAGAGRTHPVEDSPAADSRMGAAASTCVGRQLGEHEGWPTARQDSPAGLRRTR